MDNISTSFSPQTASTFPLVYIIILNWNSKADTIECLQSLHKLQYPNFRVVFVDNGSTDGSEDAVRSAFSSVEVIQTGCNLGYAGGNNVGIRYALAHGADYVWLLNNDTVVAERALTHLVDTALNNLHTAFIGSKIYYHNSPKRIWCVGGSINIEAGGVTDHPGMGQEDAGQFEDVADVGYVSGCSLLASKEAIEDLGVLPEEYFLYFEETDWNVAAQRRGWRTLLAPASHVWHKYENAEEYNERFIYYSFRNRIHIVRKYSPRDVFKAVRVNWALMKNQISSSSGRSARILLFSFLAHFDALFLRYGKARWSVLK